MVDTAGAVDLGGRVTEDSVGQAFVHDPLPSVIDAAAAAVHEGRAWLEGMENSEGVLTEDLFTERAEILRALIDSTDTLGGVLVNTINSVQTYLSAVRQELGG